MVQEIESGGTLAGRIGKGIGKGLSEQVPEEIKNYRLSKTIDELKKSNNLSPLDSLSKLASVPGGLEAAPVLLPFLRGQQARQAAEMIYKEKPTISSETTQPSKVNIEVKPQLLPSGFASSRDITRSKEKMLQPVTQQEINQLANQYFDSGMTQDYATAQSLAMNELNQNRSTQQEKNNALQQGLSQRIGLNLQGGGLGDFKDISGEIQQRLLDQGQYLVNEQGLSPEAASERMEKIATDLGKTATQTKTTGSIRNWFSPTKDKINDLKKQRREFEKYGFEEQFDDMATGALGITPQKMASVVDPLKNKEINEILDSQKKFKSFRTGFSPGKLSEKQLDKLVMSIQPEDNILSIENGLRENNIDVNQFREKLFQLESENKKALTAKQNRQSQKPVSNIMFGDFWWDARS